MTWPDAVPHEFHDAREHAVVILEAVEGDRRLAQESVMALAATGRVHDWIYAAAAVAADFTWGGLAMLYEQVWNWLDRFDREEEYARAERQELSARDRAELNAIIDEERLREQAAEDAYWERMCEEEEERRNDH